MEHKAANAMRRVLRPLVDWISVQAHIVRHCHACGTDVHCTESVCPHCGALYPAKLSPVATVAILVGLGMLVAAILLAILS